MSDPKIVLQHLDGVLGDCVEIIRIAGRTPGDDHRFFTQTLDKLQNIMDKCYDMKFRMFHEMEENLKSEYPE